MCKMKKLFSFMVMAMLVISVMPAVLGVSVGTGTGINIEVEEFAPRVWMCDDRIVLDDNIEPWRASAGEDELDERFHNYAFEGEQVVWTVLVMDKNKIDQNIDVYATVGDVQGENNDIEVNCVRKDAPIKNDLFRSCNARIQQEYLTPDPNTMSYFECTFTVETSDSMYGEYWVTVEAQDNTGLMGTMDENEFWFLNPVIALSIDGSLDFEEVRPGTDSYSDTLLLGNDADEGSGVLLDMFISGTDFYDSSSSGARCPTTNQLALDNIRYFATHGAYSSKDDALISGSGLPRIRDAEGYVSIDYGNAFSNVGTGNLFYDSHEIIQAGGSVVSGVGYKANILVPGDEMALTFKLSLPEPCVGNFDSGQIFFWGEAI